MIAGPGIIDLEEADNIAHQRNRDSSSSGRRPVVQYRNSASPRGIYREESGRLNSIPQVTSLSHRQPRLHDTFDSEEGFHMNEDVDIMTPANDRKRRRHKQYMRECQRFQRETEGKKPYFLTVTNEGIPYGPGKPAWIAEINKLARRLDPSCRDIRRQSHDDICMFKQRLNEHFDYSDDVNDNYLRSLMGKAVTRKRNDLISLINMGAECPPLVDLDVWNRLESIADSEQRHRRSEHGRYANSCRRTVGRTGALGEDGIRERLREVWGRSPDPEEVAAEMERDKGFGKCKGTNSTDQEVLRKVVHVYREKEVSRKQETRRIDIRRYKNDEMDSGNQQFNPRSSIEVCSTFQSTQACRWYCYRRK